MSQLPKRILVTGEFPQCVMYINYEYLWSAKSISVLSWRQNSFVQDPAFFLFNIFQKKLLKFDEILLTNGDFDVAIFVYR